MGTKTHTHQKNCVYCGRYFIPDCRVGNRQKSCKSKKCQSKRKKLSQKRWLKDNPDYFKGRYENTKQWRKTNPDYQRQWRAKNRKIRSEIQDEIRVVRQCGYRFFATGRGMQDTS